MDESIALVEFSKLSERVWSNPFDYARIKVGLKIWKPHRRDGKVKPKDCKYIKKRLKKACDDKSHKKKKCK